MWFARILFVLSVVAIFGCDSGSTLPVNDQEAPDQVKQALQSVADTGEIDSGLMVVQEQLEEMKATDAAKAEELLKDLEELMGLSGDAAKTKATEMIGKL